MNRKSLLICPTCLERTGKKEVLGELDNKGNLIVLRYGSDKRRATKIVSPIMLVLCGNCNEVVFYRKRK